MSAPAEVPALVSSTLDLSRQRGFITSTRHETGRLLATLAAAKSGTLAELGTGCGVGSAWLSSGAATGARVVTAELDPALAEDVQDIFALAKAKEFAIPAANCTGSNTMNGVMEAAASVNAPVIIQFSYSGAAFIAGKGVGKGDRASILGSVAGSEHATFINEVVLRSQAQAIYASENLGHFGLNLRRYAHFTSPIRRYADLLVHRAIKHALAGGKATNYEYSAHQMTALSLQCSERSRRADEAQREVDERYRAAWMEEHVGREFDGVVSGVTGLRA